jgi:hypothetical protein
MTQPTVYDVLVAIDELAAGRPQKYATRNENADYLGVDADEISAEREPTCCSAGRSNTALSKRTSNRPHLGVFLSRARGS